MNDLLTSIYDPSNEDIVLVPVTFEISTLIHDRIIYSCNVSGLNPETFFNFAIVRALFDYEQHTNSDIYSLK